jgi:phosphoglucomutase
MPETAALLEKAGAGFETVDVADHYRTSALKWLETWLTDKAFEAYVPQIAYLIERHEWDFLLDAFYQVIPFGTGGRRGLVGIGPNRINPWTIQASAQGHSQYLIQQYGASANERGIVLTYDVRKYTQKGVYSEDLPNPVMNLDGRKLAEAAAQVYAANGVRVYMFDDVRTTPELSFAIRFLNAVSGDVFSASHNLPTDNGKKVYDEFGGQLVPPHDQNLVDEVTRNVTGIQTMDFEAAQNQGLIRFIGEEVDRAYREAVSAVSLSNARHLKVVYSPLHGTGLTSVRPSLQSLGFDITLDPKTAVPSGEFENVTFHIPNPEVVESFDTSIPFATACQADLIINTDPDADRIGVMLPHGGQWHFLTGNEIGILLTHYALSKLHAADRLGPDSVIVKTDVTSSLIAEMAREKGVRCIGDLLVGFKYIGEEMNKLEAAGKMDGFVLGTEESHGYLTGNYARDKDAACAAVWIAEYAAELKQGRRNLLDALKEIYAAYGYCHNYLTEIRLLGARGMEQIKMIMTHLRETDVGAFGEYAVSRKTDRWQGEPQPHLSPTDTSARNVLIYRLRPVSGTHSMRVTVRPSGTEPKIKMYFEIVGRPCESEALASEKDRIVALRSDLEKAFMRYCYRLLGVDFPERGFLLFWQLPLDVKLKYFEIEESIAALKNQPDQSRRKAELSRVLAFLGANPIQKVDPAFEARYGEGIRSFLNLTQKKPSSVSR